MAVKANYSAEELLKKLIAFQSTSYNEQDIARWIQSYLEKQGVEVTRESFDPGRFLPDYDGQKTCNLYVDIGEGDEAVLFYGHLDVVEGPVTMFTPTKRDGWIRGRGAADMKAGVAGMIKAIERLDTDRRCLFHFVADEETSGTGARVAVEHLEEKEIDTVEAVMLEPSDDFDFIEQQGKGYAFCRVKGGFEDVWRVAHRAVNLDRELKKEHPVLGQNQIKPTKIVPHDILKEGNIVQGTEAHASRPEEGENSLINLIKQKREVEMAWTPSNSRNTLPATTKYVNGEPSLVPTVLYLDIRTMKGDHDMIMRRVKELCDGVELNVDDEGRPFLTPMDARIVQACQAAVPGATLSSGRGGSDASYYLETADNVISCFGPGQSRLIHTRKEAIREGMVEKTADVIERIIESY